MPDDRRIFPTLTVQRNLSIAKKRSRFRAWTEAECFEIFSALEYLLHRECENLSGGEMQMVAISRALLGSPGLVLLDEPSQGLAPRMVQQVLQVIRRLKREGIGVLVVEQNPLAALSVADRVYVMDKGRIVHQGGARACWTTRRCARGCWGSDDPVASKAWCKEYRRPLADHVPRWRPTSASRSRRSSA